MPRRAAIIIAAVALAVLVAACGSTGSSSEPSTTPSPESVSWLFSTTSDGGTLKETGDGGHLLTLTGVDEHTIAFADRPDRDVNVIATGDFVASWEKNFADDPPNAVLVEHNPKGATDSLVLVLSDPTYDAEAATLTYAATVTTDEHPDRVAALVGEAYAEVPASFREASLFIDTANLFDGVPAPPDPVLNQSGNFTAYTLDNWPTDPAVFEVDRWYDGQPVAARWYAGAFGNSSGNGQFYLATLNLEGEAATVTYADDGTSQSPSFSDIRFIMGDRLSVGDRVLAVWSTKARFYPGTITFVGGLTYKVEWDDGSPPSWVPVGKIIPE